MNTPLNSKLIVGLLTVVVLGSALGVVYSKHHSRKLYTKLQTLQKERDAKDVEWGRLQLEQSTWATQGRIESIARKQLNMTQLDYDKVIIVRP